jgi:hypothetical protein
VCAEYAEAGIAAIQMKKVEADEVGDDLEFLAAFDESVGLKA